MAIDMGRASLLFLRFAAEDAVYRRVIDSIADGIRDSAARLDAMPTDSDPDWQETVVDEECDLAENLLGAAFIVCQAQITAVASRALRVRELVLRRPGGRFPSFGDSPKSVRDLGESVAAPAVTTKVEVLWALANYFKHREEWRNLDWSKLTGHTERTVSVVQIAGLTGGSTGNLRSGSEFLGNPADYSHLGVFADIVDAWAQRVLAVVQAELGVT